MITASVMKGLNTGAKRTQCNSDFVYKIVVRSDTQSLKRQVVKMKVVLSSDLNKTKLA